MIAHFCNVHMDCLGPAWAQIDRYTHYIIMNIITFFVFDPIARWTSLFSFGEVIT